MGNVSTGKKGKKMNKTTMKPFPNISLSNINLSDMPNPSSEAIYAQWKEYQSQAASEAALEGLDPVFEASIPVPKVSVNAPTASNHKGSIINSQVRKEGKPIQLVKQDQQGKLVFNESALNIIKGLQGNVGVCSVVGPFRSGKSFILNLLLQRQNGFTLGATYQSCTRGIWMWDTPIILQNKHGECNFILLDTEGLCAPDAKSKLDNQIFVMALLFSSLFVYNTKNVIDRDAIKKLAVMNNLSKYINNHSHGGRTSNEDENSFNINAPDFIWVLRDFFLEVNLSPRDYLQESLRLESVGQDETDIKEVNFIRESIKNSFKSLDCYLLPMPIENGIDGRSLDETMRYLDQIKSDQMRRDFVDGIEKLCESIKANIRPKALFEKPLSALVYCNYIQEVVKQLNQDERVSLMDSLTVSIKVAAEKALKDAIMNYKNRMTEYFHKHPMPVTHDELEKQDHEAWETSTRILESTLGTSDLTKQYFEDFNGAIYYFTKDGITSKLSDGLLYQYRLQNNSEIKKYNKNKLNALWQKNIVTQFFDANSQNENICAQFSAEYEKLQKVYFSSTSGAFHMIEPEMGEAFDEWYKEKDIENVVKNLQHLSEQVRIKNENKERLLKEKAEKERIQKNFQEATEKHNESMVKMNENMRNLQSNYQFQIANVQNQLSAAQVAAAKSATTAAQAKSLAESTAADAAAKIAELKREHKNQIFKDSLEKERIKNDFEKATRRHQETIANYQSELEHIQYELSAVQIESTNTAAQAKWAADAAAASKIAELKRQHENELSRVRAAQAKAAAETAQAKAAAEAAQAKAAAEKAQAKAAAEAAQAKAAADAASASRIAELKRQHENELSRVRAAQEKAAAEAAQAKAAAEAAQAKAAAETARAKAAVEAAQAKAATETAQAKAATEAAQAKAAAEAAQAKAAAEAAQAKAAADAAAASRIAELKRQHEDELSRERAEKLRIETALNDVTSLQINSEPTSQSLQFAAMEITQNNEQTTLRFLGLEFSQNDEDHEAGLIYGAVSLEFINRDEDDDDSDSDD